MVAAFRYRALTRAGSAVTGLVEAADRQAALHELGRQGLYPTDLAAAGRMAESERAATERAAAPATPAPSVTSARARGRISRRQIAAATRELASLLEATIPIPPALDGLGSQEENPALRAVLLELAAAVRQGVSFSSALARHPRLFSRLYVSMVEVGEEAGALDRVLGDLANLLEHEDEIRSEVLGAVAYPAFVLVMGIVSTLVLLVFVMPQLFQMLEGMVAVLPWPTRALFALSHFFERFWIPFFLAVGLGALGLRTYLRTAAGALRRDSVRLRLPILGQVFRAAALGRFARTLGTLELSGVPLLPALEIVRHTVGNRRIALGIEQVAEEARAGDRLAAPLRKWQLFPATMVQMIAVGEETGRLGAMLIRVAEIQERVVRRSSSTLISLLAPLMILLVGALVGFIVISLLLPIFQMSQVMR